MVRTTYVIGTLSAGFGLVLAYLASQHGAKIATALIPTYVGVVFVAVAAVASINDGLRKHVMHGLAALSLLLAGSGLAMGVPKLVKYYNNTLPEGAPVRPLAWWGQVGLAGLMLVFLVLCVQSFIAARKARRGNG